MVQQLLGHASRETTVKWYLAPVADLHLRSMLAGAAEPIAAPMPELDAVFARVARESEGIQDLDDIGQPLAGCLVSGRGRRAALPERRPARPEYLVADGQGGLVVRHYNREGRVREYDFAELPVPAADAGFAGGPVRRPVHAGPLVRSRARPSRRGSCCGGSRSSWPGRSSRRVTWTSSPRDWCGGGGQGCRLPSGGYQPGHWSAACCEMTSRFRQDRSPTSWPAASRAPEQGPVLQRGGVRAGHGGRPAQVPVCPAAHQRQRAPPAAMAGGRVRRGQQGLGDRRGAGHHGPHRGPAQDTPQGRGSGTIEAGTATRSAGKGT